MDCEGMLTKINLLQKQKKFRETKDKVNELLNYLILKDNISEMERHYLWHCYIKLAICNRREEKFNEAIEFAKTALPYATSESEEHECYWVIGICHKYLGNSSKALFYYDKCISFYSKINYVEYLVKVLKCKALMLHDEQLLQDAIDLIKKSNNIDLAIYEDLIKTLEEIKIYNNCDNDSSISTVISLDTYKALKNKTGI
jgi:tetratricopeptide (TPR) repeat protein